MLLEQNIMKKMRNLCHFLSHFFLHPPIHPATALLDKKGQDGF